mmetsp:Transcript_3323/g.5988  ORF Transcript_3323/g.5988 Transcript_3323/m.5988 type:complete len:92 (-) Transcript_3323:38-313(-)
MSSSQIHREQGKGDILRAGDEADCCDLQPRIERDGRKSGQKPGIRTGIPARLLCIGIKPINHSKIVGMRTFEPEVVIQKAKCDKLRHSTNP